MKLWIFCIVILHSNARIILEKSLRDVVACVTGSTRGIGKGIALALAEKGATVYVTGRSATKETITETDKQLGGCLEDVVAEVNKLGGIGIPVVVDHRDDTQVKSLFDKIESEQGRLDILINNAFQIPTRPDGIFDKDLLFRDFWEQPGWYWDALINVGLRSHYISSCYAVPLLRKKRSSQRKPLIVHISSFGGVSYSFNVAYGVGKAGVDRMARDMNQELSKLGIVCVSLYPGVVRTERMQEVLDSGDWRRKTGLELPQAFVESPQLSGKVIAALFEQGNDDGYLQEVAGKVCVTAEVAKKYSIVDPISLTIPPSIRSVKFLLPSLALGYMENLRENDSSNLGGKWYNREKFERFLVGLAPDILLPMSIMAQGAPSQG